MDYAPLNLPEIDGLELEDAKQLLRSAVRKHRKNRPARLREEMGEQWVATVLDFLGDAEVVAAYVSVANEPPTDAVCKAIADSGKRLILPKLGPGLTRAWGYYKGHDDLAQMAPGRPPEPSGAAFDNDILKTVDALIIPGLLISRSGARLGQGGGWYDRALKETKPGTKIGAMVFPEEFVDIKIPQDDMDVKVPYVIHPTEFLPTAA